MSTDDHTTDEGETLSDLLEQWDERRAAKMDEERETKAEQTTREEQLAKMSERLDDTTPTVEDNPQLLYKDGEKVDDPLKDVDPTTMKAPTTEEEESFEVPVFVGHSNDGSHVAMDFGEKPIKLLKLSPKRAFQISRSLRKHADYCRKVTNPRRRHYGKKMR